MTRAPVFTIITDTYYRPAYLRIAVAAMRRQTYDNLEIILVNNGATPETVEYLHEVAARDSRVKLVHFSDNQYSPDDPFKMLFTCGNAALKISTGDFVWYQSDDDWMADDYAEKMVRLFEENSRCTTAAGRVICVDADGKALEEARMSPRPRYMPGHELAMSHLRGHSHLGAPGTIFTIRREALIRAGGFHRALDESHLYGIVPFGDTGFDPTAVFHWRRHGQQLNTYLTSNGCVGFREVMSLLADWRLEDRWRVFGPEIAVEAGARMRNIQIDSAAKWFAVNWAAGRYAAARRIVADAGRYARFWRKAPGCLWMSRGQLVERFKTTRRIASQPPSVSGAPATGAAGAGACEKSPVSTAGPCRF